MTRLNVVASIGAFSLLAVQASYGNALTISACYPEYPAPQEPGQLFYLQRTGNSNTVVYVVARTAVDKIDSQNPIRVYWRRFADAGEVKDLNFLERTLAYGVEHQAVDGDRERYLTHFVAYPKQKIVIEPAPGGRHRAVMPISGEPAQLECIYVEWRPLGGIIPNVLWVDIVGRSLDGRRRISERVVRD